MVLLVPASESALSGGQASLGPWSVARPPAGDALWSGWMASVTGGVSELTDGTIRSAGAAINGGMAPYPRSRFRRSCR